MRVCLLSKQFDPSGGGSERYAYELSRALANRNHDVDVFTLESSSHTETDTHPDNLSVTFVGRRRRSLVTLETLYYSLLARRRVDFDSYDILHGTLMPASPIALTVRPPSTPLVLTSHGTSIGEVRSHKLEVPTDVLKKFAFHPMNVLMDWATVPRADRVIAISDLAKRELTRYYPISNDRIDRIHHGVDTDRFTPDQPMHPAVDPEAFSLLHVGRLVSRKHVDLAIEGLAAVDRDDIELLIAGTGTHRERLEKAVETYDMEAQVRFLGFVPENELPALYASSDAFLFLSRYEGFGLTFLEAMAAGTPVIGTTVGGVPDLVTDGVEGLLVERTATSVAQAITALAESAETCADMSRRARQLAERRTWATVARETEAVYESVL